MKFKKKKRLLLDMTASILHHGHIKLLKKTKKLGNVEIIVALTKDEEVKKYKGFIPELKYKDRKEILEAIKYIDKVIPSKWIIDDEFLRRNNIDYLVHGSDNNNNVSKKKLILFKRTPGISSSKIKVRF
tara:strand:+ start:96 stop:482 length:387 start_codon:yes stop_codon:yes gene_type:complete